MESKSSIKSFNSLIIYTVSCLFLLSSCSQPAYTPTTEQNKQFIQTFHYWNETRDGELVARAQTSCSYASGSYGDSYTTPTLQIIGTRVKDLTILQG